jgi:hypothetical protein
MSRPVIRRILGIGHGRTMQRWGTGIDVIPYQNDQRVLRREVSQAERRAKSLVRMGKPIKRICAGIQRVEGGPDKIVPQGSSSQKSIQGMWLERAGALEKQLLSFVRCQCNNGCFRERSSVIVEISSSTENRRTVRSGEFGSAQLVLATGTLPGSYRHRALSKLRCERLRLFAYALRNSTSAEMLFCGSTGSLSESGSSADPWRGGASGQREPGVQPAAGQSAACVFFRKRRWPRIPSRRRSLFSRP